MNKEKLSASKNAYRKANLAKFSEYSRTWAKTNPEKVKAYNKAYREANKEKRRMQSKLWRTANRKRKRAVDKIYRETHKEKMKAYQKAYYQANKEKLKIQMDIWRKANPEKISVYAKNSFKKNPENQRKITRKYRALKHTTQIEPINDKIVYLRDGWVCQICHKRVDKRVKHPNPMCASLDHIIPLSHGGAHIYSNIQLAHLSCNLLKNHYVLPQGEQMRLF